jgi:hypothetical protein
MIGSGVYEVEIDGEKVGFQFGMLASIETEEAAGMVIEDVFKKIAKGFQKYIALYFLGGAIAYNKLHGIEKKVDLPMVTTYIEGMGLQQALEIYAKSIAAPVIKNGKAPAMGQA